MFYGYRLAGTDWPVSSGLLYGYRLAGHRWKEENNKQINQSNFGDNFSAPLNVAAVVKISDEFEQNGGRSEQ